MNIKYEEVLSIIDYLSNNDMYDAVDDLQSAQAGNHCVERVTENLTILKDAATRVLLMLGDMEST